MRDTPSLARLCVVSTAPPSSRSPLVLERLLAGCWLLLAGLLSLPVQAADILLTGAEGSLCMHAFTRALGELRPADTVRFQPLARLPARPLGLEIVSKHWDDTADSLASTDSDQSDWLATLDDLLDSPPATWPRSYYPQRFKVSSNPQVARSLGMEQMNEATAAARLAEGESRP